MSGLYIHFPFCRKKCIYCNFYSIAQLSQKENYLRALLKEIEIRKSYLSDLTLSTLYFGGGTPTLFSARELSVIMETISRYYTLTPNTEFTIEANPEQLTKPYLQELRKIGINRLSIGIQSFNHSTLRFLGRTHNAEEALQGVYNASEVGFDNISIDLIYGITNRQKDVWKEDLKTVFKTPISHLSAYALTIEENTLLAKKIKNGNLDTLDENIAIEDFYTLLEATSRAGFEQYEVSNFAKSGKISRHNYAYWQGTPYIGLGPSAHSYHLNSRQWNICNLTQYIDGISTNNNFYEIEFLSENSKFNEFVLLRLRTRMGIDLNLAERLFGKEKREHIQGYFTNHVAGQDYIFINQCYHLTPQGQLLADQISEGLFIV